MNQQNNKLGKQSGLMKIGQLSKESNTNKSTIHHYINLGLLPPPEKKQPRLHLFNISHLARLKVIRKLRQGKKLPLSMIKEALDKGDLSTELQVAEFPDHPIEVDHTRLSNNSLQEKRAHILDTAIDLFSRNIYGSVRMDDIAKSAQVPKATIYQYFSSKKDLFISCIERLNNTVIIPVQQIEEIKKEPDFFTRIHMRLVAFLDNFEGFRSVLNLSRMVLANEDSELSNKALEAFKLFHRVPHQDIIEAQSKGIIRDIDPEILTYMIVGMLEGLGQRLTMDFRFTPEEVGDVLMDFFRRGAGQIQAPDITNTDSEPLSGTIMHQSGTKIKVKRIRFNKQNYLPAKISGANVKVDIQKTARLTIRQSDSGWNVIVKLKDDQEISVDIDPDIILTGEVIVGSYEIQLNKIAKIFFE